MKEMPIYFTNTVLYARPSGNLGGGSKSDEKTNVEISPSLCLARNTHNIVMVSLPLALASLFRPGLP